MRRCLRCGAAVAGVGPLVEVTLARSPAPYASGDRVDGKFLVLENAGSGPLGTTYRAKDAEGKTIALKVVDPALLPDEAARQSFLEAYRALLGRSLERIAMPLDCGVADDDGVYTASPWIYGTSLRRVLRAYRAAERRLERDQVLGVLVGASASLRELHTFSSHGALYPENVRVTSDAVVLTDPGLASALHPARLATQLERFPDVLPYLAPEVRAGRRCNAGADLYALGALASELLLGDAGRAASGQFSAPDLGSDVEEALRGLVALQPSRRAASLPCLLERLARVAGEASLPPYAPLPAPAPISEARTRRVQVGPRLRAEFASFRDAPKVDVDEEPELIEVEADDDEDTDTPAV